MATYKQIIEGLQIFAKNEGLDKHNICAEHDEIFAGVESEDNLSENDLKILEENNWHRSSEGGWKHFV